MIAILIAFFAMLLLQWLTPFWWWVMVVPAVVAFFKSDSLRGAFALGAISAGTLWLLTAVYQWLTGAGRVAVRVADMTSVGSPVVLLAATALLAALAAGLAGSSGFLLRVAVRKPKPAHFS